MARTILTIAIVAVLIFAFGCKKTEKQPAAQTTVDVQKQAEKEVTKENMGKELEKVEKEIKTDVNAK